MAYKEWGQEYLSHLAGDIAAEYTEKMLNNENTNDLIGYVKEIVPMFIKEHSDIDAIDLLLEVDLLEELPKVSLFLSLVCSL